MAKKKELTEEERLEKALVPENEWPYELPEGWKWVRLNSSFVNFTSGNKKLKKKDYKSNGQFGVVDQGSDLIGGYSDKDELAYTGELPVIVFGDHTRRIKYVDFNFIQGADGVKVLKPKSFFDTKFFYYALMNLDIPNLGYRRHFTLFKTYNLPLPPRKIQQQIVDQIESLFSKLEEAKEKVESVLESSENRKSAILHKAFTGELTKRWREENGVSMDSWETYELGKLIETQYGYTESACLEEIGPKFLRITDIQEGSVNWNKVPYCKIDDKNFEKYFLQKRDIVVARTGATTGKSYLIRDEVNSVFASYLIRVTINNREKLDEDYLYQYFQSPLYWEQITDLSQGIALPGVNAKKLKTMKVPIPSLEEQLVITERAKRTIVPVIEIETICNDNLKKIDFIKKMILSRMFGKKYS